MNEKYFINPTREIQQFLIEGKVLFLPVVARCKNNLVKTAIQTELKVINGRVEEKKKTTQEMCKSVADRQ